jgi:predicted ester cyclase
MNRILSIALVFMPFLQSCTVEESDINQADNNQVVVAMIEAINDRNLDSLDLYVSKNIVRHSAATPGVVVTNIDEFRAFLKADIASMPDSVQVIDIIFGSGDYVAVRATLTGTQTGPMGPFAASGKKMELPFMGILRFEHGKIAEMWVEWDNLNALAQLGHFPPPEN